MTTPTDPAELEKLKALAEAATPGPFGVAECRLAYPWLTLALDKPEANFIAAANPQVVAALIAEVERLQRNERLLKDAWNRYQRRDLGREEFEGTVAEMAETR